MIDRVETWIKKTQVISVGLERGFVGQCDHRRPNRCSGRSTTQDAPATSRTPPNATVDIISRLWIGIDGDIGNLAVASRIRVGDPRPLLPGRHIPHFADSTTAGAILYSAVIPYSLRLVGIVSIDAQGGTTHTCHIRLRCRVIYRGGGVATCLRIITARRAQITTGSQYGLTLRGRSLEKDILLLNFVGYSRALFTKNPACTHHWRAVIDDMRPGIVISGQRTDRGFIDPQRGEAGGQSQHHFHVKFHLGSICPRGAVVAIDGNSLYLGILSAETGCVEGDIVWRVTVQLEQTYGLAFA